MISNFDLKKKFLMIILQHKLFYLIIINVTYLAYNLSSQYANEFLPILLLIMCETIYFQAYIFKNIYKS
jgi:hypothetical protein